MNNKEYFERFFEEKEIPYTSWNLTSNKGEIHIIDTDVVIEFIRNVADSENGNIFRKKLVQLDFMNQPIVPFLKYIAEGIIELNL